MKLHTGKLYWPSTLPNAAKYPVLDRDLHCEVLIVGGGVGGVLCAYLLAERGIDAVLVERDKIAGGSTMASTGLLQYASDKTLASMIRTFGEEPAVHFYNLSRTALERLKQIAGRLEGAARLTERSSIYLASSEGDVKALREECAALQRFGFPAIWWSAGDLADRFPFRYPGAIYAGGDAEMNPYAFVHGLVQKAAQLGVKVYERSKMRGSERGDDGRIRCLCGEGRVTARHVIWATGYEAQQFKKESGAHFRASYVTVTEPASSLNDWFEHCLIWETARPYLYMRTTPDGRIIAGGLDEILPGGELPEGREIRQSERLLSEIRRRFPNQEGLNADFGWGAVFGESRDGLPFIGLHPKYPNFYFLEGYGGNGTVCSMIAAEMIVDQLTGIRREDMAMFSLIRSSKPKPVPTQQQ
ncbi:FAD-binding oxidoreductase [Paenibacillus sp. MBLB2552]|uniref:FAD-binding oxidoreductase n=1 Tax=Paenibacillus mellifer TaxID=2937794 RepID=A0A9X2BRU0_9BACL|nr:FAD-binding oxidoreductase [Paenibacillus mellifer]MCK8486006.1 FAD-binding oxidoreductase [Paenibacillus mellifer]